MVTNTDKEKYGFLYSVTESYFRNVHYRNPVQALCFFILGTCSFYGLGYYVMSVIKHQFLFSSFVSMLISGVLFALFEWFLKAILLDKLCSLSQIKSSITLFLTIDGFSKMTFFLMIPFVLLTAGTFAGHWFIGLGVFLQYFLTFASFKNELVVSNLFASGLTGFSIMVSVACLTLLYWGGMISR